jgi:hypothetical protein
MSPPVPGNPGAAVVSAGAQTPATDDDFSALKTQFDKVVNNEVGRLIPVITAVAIPVLTAVCAWLQKQLGIKLDPAALAAFIASMGAGIVLTAYKWMSNRGHWERAVLDAYKVYLTDTPAAPAARANS